MKTEPITIAHLVSTLSRNSGVVAVIMNYFRHIDRERFRFDFLYFRETTDETYHDEIRRLGGRCVRIDEPSLSPATIKRVKDVFAQSGYSVLHIHELYLAFWIAPIARRAGISAVIVHAHTTKFAETPRKAVRNRLLCLPALSLSDYQCACSDAAAKTYFGKRITESERYFPVHNAINLSEYRFSAEDRSLYRKAFGFSDNNIVIGNVGRLSPQKNQEFLLKTFSVLLEREGRLKLLMLGTGPLCNELKAVCESLHITDSVVWAGQRTDAARIYSSFDAFFLPSRFEGLGNVLIEAQCNGLPCFASHAVPQEAFILDTCRRVEIRKGATHSAEQIRPYLDELSRDENALSKVAQAGYDINVESGHLAEFYERVLSK